MPISLMNPGVKSHGRTFLPLLEVVSRSVAVLFCPFILCCEVSDEVYPVFVPCHSVTKKSLSYENLSKLLLHKHSTFVETEITSST